LNQYLPHHSFHLFSTLYFEFIWLPFLNECSDVLHLFLITY